MAPANKWPLTTACLHHHHHHQPQCSCLLRPPLETSSGFPGLPSPAELICQVGLTLNVNGRGQRRVNQPSGCDERHSSDSRLPLCFSSLCFPSVRTAQASAGTFQETFCFFRRRTKETVGTAEAFMLPLWIEVIARSAGLTNRSR